MTQGKLSHSKHRIQFMKVTLNYIKINWSCKLHIIIFLLKDIQSNQLLFMGNTLHIHV